MRKVLTQIIRILEELLVPSGANNIIYICHSLEKAQILDNYQSTCVKDAYNRFESEDIFSKTQ